MATYNRYPAIDENNNFPPAVRQAILESSEFRNEFLKSSVTKVNPFKRKIQEWRGNSWADKARTNFTAGESIGELVADIYGGVFQARAVSSRGMVDAAYTAIGLGSYQFQPRSKNVVFFCDTWLNDSRYNGTTEASLLSYRYSIESIMSALTANAYTPSNTSAWTFDGSFISETTAVYAGAPSGASTPAQGTVLSSGGVRWRTNTSGAAAFFNIIGSEVDIQFSIPVGGGGTYELYEGTTLVKSVNFSARVKQEAPAIMSVRGLTNARHNFKLVNKSGTMIVDSFRIPLPKSNHTRIVFVPAPTMPLGGGNILPAGDPTDTYDAARTLFLNILKDVVKAYPTATIIDTNVVAWPTTMFSNDNRHLNDMGNALLATVISDQLINVGYSEGLNSLSTNGYAVEYTPAGNPSIPSGGVNGVGSATPPKPVTAYTGTDWHYSADSLVPTNALDAWPAAQSNMPDLIRNTASMRPSVTNENGRPTVFFDGVDDGLIAAGAPRTDVETIAVLAKVRAIEAGSSRRYLASVTGTTVATMGIGSAANMWVASQGTPMTIPFATEPFNDGYNVFIFVMNGDNSVYRVNATEVEGPAGVQTGKTGLIIARNSGDSELTSAPISVMDVMHFPKALNASERNAVYNYLKAKASPVANPL